MSFFKKFHRHRKSSETGSFGSSLSIKSIGTNKKLNTTYSVNEKELPPFLKAIWRNSISKVKKLMKKDYNIVDKEQRSGLHLACAMGNEEMIRELLGNYCNELLEKRDNFGRTGLFKAVEAGAFECVQLLIEKGAKTDVTDIFGDTVVHASVKHKQIETLQYMLESRCSASQLNKEGLAPIHIATSVNCIDAVHLLLQNNVDINQLTSSDKSALILAAESGNLSLLKELLANNANMSIVDSDGNDAYYYANYHQYNDCAAQLKSLSEFIEVKTPPRRVTSLQMPEFIVSQSPDSRELLSSNHSKKSNVHHENSIDENKRASVKTDDLKNRSPERKERVNSIKLENSWSEDFSHYSSDTTLPNMKTRNIHDISTPSSMPNPSEDASNPLQPLSNGMSRTHLNKQHSDDEESQWTDTDVYNYSVDVPVQHIKNDLGLHPEPIKKTDVVEIIKHDDSDWDSNTEHDKDDVDGNLSTIDEESLGKQDAMLMATKVEIKKTHNNSVLHSSIPILPRTKIKKNEDGHQTDSNIEECYNTNYVFLNKPVRYDSCETLEKSIDYDDDDTELSQTKIPNPRFKGETSAPFTKPPVSPMNKGDNIPIVTIEDASSHAKVARSGGGGDNLSYSSTDLSSRRDSLAGSDIQADYDKNGPKLTEEYIKKCSNMESKLRIIESEKDILKQDMKRSTDSKNKLEQEKIKLQKDYQQIEALLTEKKIELDEIKSRFTISEDLLKSREKELFDSKKANQDLIGNLNEKEMKNISSDSKIKQLKHEIANLQSELQRSTHSEKDVEYHKSQYESEREQWLKKNEDLNNEITDLRQQINKSKTDSDKIIAEQKNYIQNCQDKITGLTKTLKNNEEDEINRSEEIEQLKKTINNLNADLESSNKSAALVAKEEQKNKILNDQLKEEVKKVSDLRTEIQNIKKQNSDLDLSLSRTKQEMDRLRNQMVEKEDTLAKFELKCRSSDNQLKDLEKLLESKIMEVKELNAKCRDLDDALHSEKNAKDNIVERVNAAINSAISLCPDSQEVIEQLQDIRKSLNGFNPNNNAMNTSLAAYQDLDSSIELSKAKSQIRVLQDQLNDVRRDLKLSQEDVLVPRRGLQLQSGDYADINYENQTLISSNLLSKLNHISNILSSEIDRVNKIERLEKENQSELKEQTRLLRKTQQQEKQKSQLLQEKEKALTIQLNNLVKSNKALTDIQEAVKQVLNRFNRQIISDDKLAIASSIDFQSSLDISGIDLPLFCSKMLQQLSDVIDDLKLKHKKVELEKLALEEEQKCQDNKHVTLVENSRIILTQQLSEMTQMMDSQRGNREKLEKIRDENEFQLRNELYQLRQNNSMELSELNQLLNRAEKDRDELLLEVKSLSEQLMKERNLKDSLTEQMVNIMRNPNGSVQQIHGSKEFVFPSAGAINSTSSQWNIPNNIVDNERKAFSTSMSNLTLLKCNAVEDDELRQRLRKELDRSIAKHLESGRPIRQLNVKDKIRSLNIVRYANNNMAWKNI